MRNLFPGFYRPTDEEFATLWKECTFVFDTNVLLLPYRSTQATWQKFSEILEKLQDRVWIPYQVAQEYQNNRISIISEQQVDIYEDIKKLFKEIESSIDAFNSFRQHPFIDFESIKRDFLRALEKSRKLVSKAQKAQPDLIGEDPFRDKLDVIFNGKVGTPYPEDVLLEKIEYVKERLKKKNIPGYADADEKQKKGLDIHGDGILWLQILDYARENRKPIIFVTNDTKNDWWQKTKSGRNIGPKRELIEEMRSDAGMAFYMYPIISFIRYAEDFLQLQHQPEVIEDLEELIDYDNNKAQNLLLSQKAIEEEADARMRYSSNTFNTVANSSEIMQSILDSAGIHSSAAIQSALEQSAAVRSAEIMRGIWDVVNLSPSALQAYHTAAVLPASLQSALQAYHTAAALPASLQSALQAYHNAAALPASLQSVLEQSAALNAARALQINKEDKEDTQEG